MKKLMIAAIAAAAGLTAFGATDCGPSTPDVAWAYVWKFTGKTTTGNKGVAVSTSLCGPGTAAACTYRVPASLKIQGYTYVCKPNACIDDEVNFWNAAKFAEMDEVFYMTKPYKASFYGGVTTEFAQIIGKAKKQVEVIGKATLKDNIEGATFAFTWAGLGKYDLKNKRISSVSGNFAGTLSQPYAILKNATVCPKAGYWNCSTLALECSGASVAYGKWSVKYNAKGSKNWLQGKAIKTPNWVIWMNRN